MERQTGRIARLIHEKGFGFIRSGAVERFFHYSAVRGAHFDALTEGQEVTFTVGDSAKGPRAEDVALVG